ncbi:urea ABC transporter permease subunit UrtC [Alphaproteobacteria bacterium]|nr:urea ABC transporter permease subunit UrtC [Alphaproteobacteria bacterium]
MIDFTKMRDRKNALFFFLSIILIFTIIVTLMTEAYGLNIISTSFLKILGKTLCLCIVALAMDLVWGYCGILSLGHFAFFGLGGYMIGMWLMFERTKNIVIKSSENIALPLTEQEIDEAIGNQIFGVVGSGEIPIVWYFADSLIIHLFLIILVPGILAFIFGWLAFRSRVTGVYLSILTQAMTLALSLYLFQNDSGLRGNNGLSGLQNIPNIGQISQAKLSAWFFIASSTTLILTYFICNIIINSKLGNIITGIRENETRVRFLGYQVESYKLFIFVITAIMSAIAGALYYPQAGIINPAELAPIASIYLAVWVAIGGRGTLYGAVIGAAFVSLTSSYFTGGQIPDITFDWVTIKWVDWWTVILGLSFVITTLYAPKGIGGLIEIIFRKK